MVPFGLVLLLALSIWVGNDARKRGMSARWGVGVGLMLIVFLPLYFVVRKPLLGTKCEGCGRRVDDSAEVCWECGAPTAKAAAAAGVETGRDGRLFG